MSVSVFVIYELEIICTYIVLGIFMIHLHTRLHTPDFRVYVLQTSNRKLSIDFFQLPPVYIAQKKKHYPDRRCIFFENLLT
jgi:hypothetical protein